jgi:Thioesterase superfamily
VRSPDAEHDAQLNSLAEAIRRLSRSLLTTAVPCDALAEAEAVVNRLTDDLDAARRPPSGAGMDDDRRLRMFNAVEGSANVTAPPLRTSTLYPGAITGTVTLSSLAGGAESRSHGGWPAAILDQSMGRAIVTAGSTSLTINLEVGYHKATPLDVPLRVRATCVGLTRRALTVTGRLEYEDELLVSSTGLFLIPHEGLAAVERALAGGSLQPAGDVA